MRRLVVLIALLVTACTDADPEGPRPLVGPSAVPNPSTPTPSPAPPPTPSAPAGNVTALENEVVALVNQQRAQGASCGLRGTMPPVGPVTIHETLRRVARAHSEDMQTRRFFAHINPDGLAPADRIRNAGYNASGSGENIAVGTPTARSVMDMWMQSPDHCFNIMFAQWTRIGVGFAPPSNYWTQIFTTN